MLFQIGAKEMKSVEYVRCVPFVEQQDVLFVESMMCDGIVAVDGGVCVCKVRRVRNLDD